MQVTSFRGSILRGLALLTLIQFILMVAIAVYSYHLGEDSSLARVVSSNSVITEYGRNDRTPAALASNLFDFPPGVHELSYENDQKPNDAEAHAYVFQDNGTTRVRILQLDEPENFGSHTRGYSLFATITIVLLLAFGVWTAHMIAHRLSNPMEVLAAKLQLPDAMDGSREFSSKEQTREIALVASALDKAIASVRETRDREKTLSRNISHELRTPLTVIKTALDTGEANSLPPSLNALNRAQQACDEMELLTGACLELARNSTHLGTAASTNIVSIVKQITRESLHLLDEKIVQLDLKFESQDIEFPVSEPLVRLVVGNAIRNSFIHCTDGEIRIEVNARYLSISNLTANPEASAKDADIKRSGTQSSYKTGFGYGLSIMGQACKRLGWSYATFRRPLIDDEVLQVEVTVSFA